MASFGTGSRAPVIPWLAFQSSRVRLPSQSFQRRELHFGPCRNLASHDQLVSRKAGKMSVIPDPDFEDFARAPHILVSALLPAGRLFDTGAGLRSRLKSSAIQRADRSD